MHDKKYTNRTRSARQRKHRKLIGGAEAAEDKTPEPLDINQLVEGLISISLNITMIVAIILLLMIVILSVINLIIIGILVGSDTLGYDSDVIYKDTLKYKILRYVDYLNAKGKGREQALSEETSQDQSQPETTTQSTSILAFLGITPTASTAATSATPATPATTPATPALIAQTTTTTTTPSRPKTPSEPYFFIYSGNVSMLSGIYLCYVFLIVVCILAAIIYIVFAYFVKILYKDFQVKVDGPSNITSTLFSVSTFAGIGAAAVLGIFHWVYFNNVITPALTTIRKAIYDIDSYINKGLTEKSKQFNAELFTALSNKTKGIDDLAKYKEFIQKDIAAGQLDKAKQKIIMIILYSHLHDQIPNTNTRAQTLINYYFFKNPVTQSENLDFKDTDELNDLTFISLLVESTGIQQVKRDYYEYDFYTCTSALKQSDVETVRSQVKAFFKTLNNKLLSFPEFKSNMDLFAGYFIVFLVLSFILAYFFFNTIKNNRNTLNSSITSLATNISSAMSLIAPPLKNIADKVGGSVNHAVIKTMPENSDKPVSNEENKAHDSVFGLAQSNIGMKAIDTITNLASIAAPPPVGMALKTMNKAKSEPLLGSIISSIL